MGSEGSLSEFATPVFRYSVDDVPTFRDVGNTKSHYSELDQLLLSQWDRAMSCGEIFRYSLSDVSTRKVPGQFGFIVQQNPKRFSHRRPPADMRTLMQPFDPKLFNFNQVRREEVLFEIQRKQLPHDGNQEEEKHQIIVNVSPIDYGHVLFVPEPHSCFSQVMTESSLRMCLEIMALSGHSGLCMLSNSLLAYASVNHLHYHFLYIDHPLLANRVGGEHLAGGCYELTGHPSRGFGFQMDTTAEDCGREIYKVISVCLDSGIPHNVVMLRGGSFEKDNAGQGSLVRILVIPRKPVYGLKQLYEAGGGNRPFFAAASELVLGFIPVIDQEEYSTLTEEEILEILHEVTLSKEDFESLKQRIKLILEA